MSIPDKLHPFDMDALQTTPLEGHDLFECRPANGTPASTETCDQCGENVSTAAQHGPWVNPNPERHKELLQLTHGFEDNFVEAWASKPDGMGSSPPKQGIVGRSPTSTSPTSLAHTDPDQEFCFSADKDPVFRTVSGRYTVSEII